MNTIREIQNLNKRELEIGVSTSGSWHADYRDTAYIYIGGLPYNLSEGDVITIFSQFGEVVYLNLVRDKESGKSKGFAFLKYEDQRSTDLAVDNFGGVALMGRVLKVDHTRYKRKDDEEEVERERAMNEFAGAGAGAGRGKNGDQDGGGDDSGEGSEGSKRPLLPEERELAALIRDHDDDDPMKEYLVKEKKEEVANALARLAKKARKSADGKKHHHRHHHRRHRSRRRSRGSTPAENTKETRRSRRHSNDTESDRDTRRKDRRHQRRSRSP